MGDKIPNTFGAGFKKTVNIEHYQIDQDTEYAVEEILEYAKQEGMFKELEGGLKDFLAGGNVIRFLEQCEDIALQIAVTTKSPRKRKRAKNDFRKIVEFKDDQLSYYTDFGEFVKYPAHKGKLLSAHLLK